MVGTASAIHYFQPASTDESSSQSQTGTDMTIALPASPARRGLGIDLSKPVLIVFAVILFFLIAMPLSWLVLYAFSTKNGSFTLDNFSRLLSDAAFLDPLLTTFALATLSAIICCIVAAPMGWLVGPADTAPRRPVRVAVAGALGH